jgi:Protein of unknown function (DUF3987)
VDQYPHRAAREKAWAVFERIAKIDQNAALKLGAEQGHYDKVPALRFDEAALSDFLDWRKDLERQLRSAELSPALEGHLAKYRKLVPALALIHHIADSGEGLVSQRALLKALATAHYLKSHARRVYGSTDEAELAATWVLNLCRRERAGFRSSSFRRPAGITARSSLTSNSSPRRTSARIAGDRRSTTAAPFCSNGLSERRSCDGPPQIYSACTHRRTSRIRATTD